MADNEPAPPPTREQRLAQRASPDEPCVLFQNWRDLLFLHWRWDADDLCRRLPRQLTLDTFGGEAYLGLIPFFMRDVRPRWLPAAPYFSRFLEVNLRTYVYDEEGNPGVWFFSLDTNSLMTTLGARALYRLPYYPARMSGQGSRYPDGVQLSVRRWGSSEGGVFCYKPGGVLAEPSVDSLEFFLVERYLLFAGRSGRLLRARVEHPPYPLRQVTLREWSVNLLKLDGFSAPTGGPDHVLFSSGVDVKTYPPRRVRSGG